MKQRRKPTAPDYFNDSRMTDLVLQWQQLAADDPKRHDLEGQMAPSVMEMVYRIGGDWQHFRIDLDDAVSVFWIHWIRAIRRFDLSRGSLFAWSTTMCLNVLRGMWNSDRTYEDHVLRYAYDSQGPEMQDFLVDQDMYDPERSFRDHRSDPNRVGAVRARLLKQRNRR